MSESSDDNMKKDLLIRRDRLTCTNCGCNYASQQTIFGIKRAEGPTKPINDYVPDHKFTDGFCQALSIRFKGDDVIENQKRAEGCKLFWPYGFKRDNCSKEYLDNDDRWYEKDSIA